jgi:hypothetical protein
MEPRLSDPMSLLFTVVTVGGNLPEQFFESVGGTVPAK